MIVSEAIEKSRGGKALFLNRLSVKYADKLLLENENVLTAVIANIKTPRDSYPGVVVLTDQRVFAACGLPGIKRSVIIPLDELDDCGESGTVIMYTATFRSKDKTFSMSIDPDDGEEFTRYAAMINGEDFVDVQINMEKGSIFNPNIIRCRKRNQIRKRQEKERDLARQVVIQREAAERFDNMERRFSK